MLDVTLRASQAISTLISTARQGDRGGLRISLARKLVQGPNLALDVADEPVDGDEVVAGDLGSRVFLDHTAARCLTDQVLDVQGDGRGRFRFTVHPKT